MHTTALLGALALTVGIGYGTIRFSEARGDTRSPLEDMEVIEASLAYKKPNAKTKQPQKPKDAPVPEVKPDGVSRDENKKVDEKKDKKDPPKKDEVTDPLAKYRRTQENDVGVTTPDQGADDGDELGRGNITKGDPYFQRLWADLDWTVPELAKTGGKETVSCVKFNADGTIARTWFKAEGDDDIATLAQAAMKELKVKRNASPLEVPTHLLQRLTGKGICFNLTAK